MFIGQEFFFSYCRISCKHTYNTNWKRKFSSKEDPEEEADEPIKFSTSKAAEPIRKPIPKPWYHEYVVGLGWAAFGIYFGILREENDIDIMLSRDLSYHVDTYGDKT